MSDRQYQTDLKKGDWLTIDEVSEMRPVPDAIKGRAARSVQVRAGLVPHPMRRLAEEIMGEAIETIFKEWAEEILTGRGKMSDECQGSVFMAEVSQYYKGGSFGKTVKLRRLKTKSCGGCESCGWEEDAYCDVNEDFGIIGIETAQHRKLYKVDIGNVAYCPETGVPDSYDLLLCEYHEAK